VDRWERTDKIVDRVEEIFLVIFLSSMIVIAFFQIVLRNLFSTGLPWGDSLVRNLVLWIGFIGAAIATREGKHITINVVSQWVPALEKVYIELLTQLFSVVICGLLTFAALKFIENEAQMGNIALLGISAWILEIILPIIFGLMTLQFGFHSFKSLSTIMKMGESDHRGGKT
jgi:TRAP-type C4-dicarboxylate transport system permease small subunit